jgi:hypothetical protein
MDNGEEIENLCTELVGEDKEVDGRKPASPIKARPFFSIRLQ